MNRIKSAALACLAASLLLVTLLAAPASAQIQGGVQQRGQATASNCASWYANGAIQDAGAPCGTGTGTVTSVSVTTANGVSATVANPTTTPALTFTLGAITPSSVAIGGAAVPTNGVLAANYSPGANITTNGFLLENPNAATAGNQQYACTQLTGFGWKTTTTAASQQVDWQFCNEPVQGSTNPTANLVFQPQINGGGYAPLFTISTVDSGGNAAATIASSNTTGTVLNINNTSVGGKSYVIGSTGSSSGVGAGLFLFYDATDARSQLTINGTANSVYMPSLAVFGFSSNNGGTTAPDTILSRLAAATLQLGAADAAAPVAQTLGVQSVVAGTTNTAGANWAHAGSRSTGSGVSGDIIFQTGGTGAAATVQNSLVNALVIKGATQLVQLPAITTDSGKTDATICEDTTNHSLYSGSGTLGICLGTSSIRYKHDVSPLAEGLKTIMALNPKRYYLNADHGDPTKPYYGFIAEDCSKVIPELTGLDSAGKPNTCDYLGLIPVLVNALKQQQAEIEGLHRFH